MPALVLDSSGRAFGLFTLFRSMLGVMTWLGRWAVLSAADGIGPIPRSGAQTPISAQIITRAENPLREPWSGAQGHFADVCSGGSIEISWCPQRCWRSCLRQMPALEHGEGSGDGTDDPEGADQVPERVPDL